jgi:hypothetical protein
VLSGSNSAADKIRYYSGFLMIAVYVALGLLFLFTDIASDTFPVYRKPVGCVFILYAAMRAFLNIRKQKEKNKDEL